MAAAAEASVGSVVWCQNRCDSKRVCLLRACQQGPTGQSLILLIAYLHARHVVSVCTACQAQNPLNPVLCTQMGSGMGARQQSVGVALTTPAGTPVVQAGVKSLRSTKTSLAAINKKLTRPRCTKIICTLGPSCWSEEGMSKLLDAGCDIVRFNFSHGDHAAHQEV